jgi:hypothetical protein
VTATCDGPAVNFAMFKALGAKLNVNDFLETKLDLETEEPVETVFDICHMEKLVGNSWATLGIIKNFQGQEINWDYIVRLHDLQMKEKLHLANKLSLEHINWRDQKMKTKLAVQTISHRNASAIDFARDVLKLDQFKVKLWKIIFYYLFIKQNGCFFMKREKDAEGFELEIISLL